MAFEIPDDHGLEVLRRSAEEVNSSPTAYRLRTTATGTFTPTGLTTEGKFTEVTINTSTWTALPATALSARNTINIQNDTGENVKLNYDSGVVGFVGILLPDGGERSYPITDSIVIYAKSETTDGVVLGVEELA